MPYVDHMPIDPTRAKEMIATLQKEVRRRDGSARTDDFASLRDVDAKVRDLRLILGDAGAHALLQEMDNDPDFAANSRRVRLEAVSNHCATALKFFGTGLIQPKKLLFRAPSFAKLTSIMPDLEVVVQGRWLEAQRCQHAKAFVAAVVMMGSILEALLLARCSMSPSHAYQSAAAPKDRSGNTLAIPDWNLHSLIEVAVEQRWLKSDRGRFSHALRESRNIVHPYEHARSKADLDEATCTTCWHVLNSSVEDLIASVT